MTKNRIENCKKYYLIIFLIISALGASFLSEAFFNSLLTTTILQFENSGVSSLSQIGKFKNFSSFL